MPIISLQRKLHEAGRIRIGAQVAAKDKNGNDTTRPTKLDKFRFTSADKTAMLAIADLCGGEVTPWEGAPVGEQFELYADCKCLDVLVPPVELAFSQWMELWAGRECKKRCDGQTDVMHDMPCSCDPDNMECKPTTRLGVILTAIQGIGVWRLETHGWNAAQELLGTIEVLRVIQSSGAMVPARLLLKQRQSKRDGKTYNYAVPVLDLNLSVAALTGGTEMPRLAAGTPIPQASGVAQGIAEQVRAVETIATPAPRANAAATLPPTGLAPRPATQAANPTRTQVFADARAEGEASAAVARKQDAASASGVPLMTEPQKRNIERLWKKLTIDDRRIRIDQYSKWFGRPFETSLELTKREASDVIEKLMIEAGEEVKPRTARTPAPPPVDDAPPPDDSMFAGYSEEPF